MAIVIQDFIDWAPETSKVENSYVKPVSKAQFTVLSETTIQFLTVGLFNNLIDGDPVNCSTDDRLPEGLTVVTKYIHKISFLIASLHTSADDAIDGINPVSITSNGRGNHYINFNYGFLLKATLKGKTSGSEPVWNRDIYSLTTDNTIEWKTIEPLTSDYNTLDFLPEKRQEEDAFIKIAGLLNHGAAIYKQESQPLFYKYKDYLNLPERFILEIIYERGFEYLATAKFLNTSQLAVLLSYLNLIKFLKGTTKGFLLVLKLLHFQYTETVWWKQDPVGVPYTYRLVLEINIDEYVSEFIRTGIINFLRNYIFPVPKDLEIRLQFANYSHSLMQVTNPHVTIKLESKYKDILMSLRQISAPRGIINIIGEAAIPMALLESRTDTSIDISWNDVAESDPIDDFLIYVDDTDDTFGSLFTGYDPKDVSNVTFTDTISGLTANSPYFIMVNYIIGVDESTPSYILSTGTLPVTPTVDPATDITGDSFTANFDLGGLSGLLYVYDDMDIVLEDWNGISISGTSHSVTGIGLGDFSYKVVSIGTYGNSAFSDPESVTTSAGPTGLLAEYLFTADETDSVNSYDGTFSGGAALDGTTADFDGQDAKLNLPIELVNDFATFTDSITITMWVNFDSFADHTSQQIVFATPGGGYGSSQHASMIYDSVSNQLQTNNGYNISASLSTGSWYFIAMVITDKNKHKVYYDGTYSIFDDPAGSPDITDFIIGYRNTTGLGIDGKIDTIQIWDHELITDDLAFLEGLGRE